jgi:hypothetical protein
MLVDAFVVGDWKKKLKTIVTFFQVAALTNGWQLIDKSMTIPTKGIKWCNVLDEGSPQDLALIRFLQF